MSDQGADLSRIAAHYHQQFSGGTWSIEYESRSDLEIEEYLLGRVNFPVRYGTYPHMNPS